VLDLLASDLLVVDLPISSARLPFDLTSVWAAVWPAVAIALLRIGDVSLNVFRTVFVVQERRLLASLTAGAEAGMWLSAAGIVFSSMTPVRAAGFVVGVATGTAIGVQLTSRMRLGMSTVRVYTDAERLGVDGRPLDLGERIAHEIRVAGHGATVFRGRGYRGEVDMVLSTVRRRDAQAVLAIARRVDGSSFAAVDNAIQPASAPAASTAGRV
jgi:uncharacterized protein YebE (UPF0316 family)